MSTDTQPPTLVCLIGPPAVGKTTVGQALCRHTGFTLFHGHVVADVLSPYFPHGTPSFARLGQTWRRTFLEEAVRADLDVVTTVAWRFSLPGDADSVVDWLQPYIEGGCVLCVELVAPVEVRLARNRSADRRRHKNPYWVTDASIREGEAAYRYDSSGTFPFDLPHLRLETAHLLAETAAQRIAEHFALPWREDVTQPDHR
jgi:cytidylate kinase